MKYLENIVERFIVLAHDYDPEEAEDWRAQTYEGIEEEQKEITEKKVVPTAAAPGFGHPTHREVGSGLDYYEVISEVKSFLEDSHGILPVIDYVESKVPAPGKWKGAQYEIDPNGLIQLITHRDYPNSFYYWYFHRDEYNSDRPFLRMMSDLKLLMRHAYNISEAALQGLSGSELEEVNIRRSLVHWSNEYEHIEHAKKEVLAVQNVAKELRNLEVLLPAIKNLIEFISSRSGLMRPVVDNPGTDKEERRTQVYFKIPKHLLLKPLNTDERRHNIGDTSKYLVRLYSTIRANALEIANYSKEVVSGGQPYEDVKRIRKKPKHFLPLPEGLPKELSDYIFKTFRDRDAAINEIMRMQEFFTSSRFKRGTILFWEIYQSITGKNITNWYRAFAYKSKYLPTFLEDFKKLEIEEAHKALGDSIEPILDKLVTEVGKPQAIGKITAAMAASTDILHNFEVLISGDGMLREEFFKLYKAGKGGYFKFHIVSKYLYVYQSMGVGTYDGASNDTKTSLLKAAEMGLFSLEDFNNVMDDFEQISFSDIKRTDYDVIKKAESYVKSTESIQHIVEFEEKREDKNELLFNLDESATFEGKDIEFKVLRDRDPMHFFIGLETDCCQHLGGVGRDATIDSYINKNAGVLVLYVNDAIIAQSYFHFVPKKESTPEEDMQPIKERLFDPVEDLEVSVRTANTLDAMNIEFIGELAILTPDLLKQRMTDTLNRPGARYSRRVYKELTRALEDIGLHIGMKMEGWPENASDFIHDVNLDRQRVVSGKERKYSETAIEETAAAMSIEIPLPKVEDYGIILDNVEAHEGRMKDVAISRKNLDELYANYAKNIADKLDLNYVKCGMDYNALSERSFEDTSMAKDPRTFKSEEQYSDFDSERHLDLLDYDPSGRRKDDDYVYASLKGIVRRFIRLAAS